MLRLTYMFPAHEILAFEQKIPCLTKQFKNSYLHCVDHVGGQAPDKDAAVPRDGDEVAAVGAEGQPRHQLAVACHTNSFTITILRVVKREWTVREENGDKYKCKLR